MCLNIRRAEFFSHSVVAIVEQSKFSSISNIGTAFYTQKLWPLVSNFNRIVCSYLQVFSNSHVLFVPVLFCELTLAAHCQVL